MLGTNFLGAMGTIAPIKISPAVVA